MSELEPKGTDKEQETAPEAEAAEAKTEKTEKPLLPRKRKIVKNNQLLVASCIAGAALLVFVGWKMFFDQSFIGTWHYEFEASAQTADTADMAADGDLSETADEAVRQRRVVYEFGKDGSCKVSYGTMTVAGGYETATTQDMGNVISASVTYGYSPVFYGTYKYEVKGNVFTGKKLVLENAYYDEEPLILDKGSPKDPLTPYTDQKLDERLTGKWFDSENNITYEFTEDGEMYRYTSDGMTVRHIYTIMQNNVILAKYYSDMEETYSYGYEFRDDVLYIDGFVMQKLDH